jgi:putative membrane protein
VRLFVYFSETEALPEPDKSILQKQYQLMQRRLWYGITWPSAIITLVLGSLLIFQYGYIPNWLWVKLCFVVILYFYQFYCHTIFLQHQQGIVVLSSAQLRLYNEVATVLLFAIVFLVVLKESLGWVYGLASVSVLILVLLFGIYVYKLFRTKK